jgi:hypothetical protein
MLFEDLVEPKSLQDMVDEGESPNDLGVELEATRGRRRRHPLDTPS